MRWVVVLLAVACAGALYFRTQAHRTEEAAIAAPQRADLSRLPPELRGILGTTPDPAAILRSSGALPGLGAIKRLVGQGQTKTPEAGTTPFADVGTPRRLRLVRRDVRRDLGALNRLSKGDGASPAEAADTLAEVYSAPILTALGPGGRRAFAERVAGRTQVAQHINVLGFDGIFVSNRRALAQVVYRISVRAPSGRFIARSPQTWTVTLAREGGRWRFVHGFEAR
jgi:hypothetical protein